MRAPAPAKINLALVVGPMRTDGKHEVVTVYQRVAIADRIDLDPAPALLVEGFDADTLVRGALEAIASRAGVEPRWHVRIEKRLPIAAGMALFGEALPGGWRAAARIAAFALVLAGAFALSLRDDSATILTDESIKEHGGWRSSSTVRASHSG